MKKELLFSVTKKDFEIQTFRSGGKGGQNQNKVESGVRIIHEKSGAIGESREERSQLQNRKNAFRRMVDTEKFKKWLKLEASKHLSTWKTQEQLFEEVEKWINDKYIKVETKQEGKWTNATVIQQEE